MEGKKGSKREIGYAYEKRAADFLEKKGYKILQQNFYAKYGEIDLVAEDNEYLVFVEVRYRSGVRGGHPLETVDRNKQNRIRKAANFYLLRYGIPQEKPCRFDVVAILNEEIIHIENAFY